MSFLCDGRRRPRPSGSVPPRLRRLGGGPARLRASRSSTAPRWASPAVEAQERFSAGASAVSLFLVLQLAVYAGLQVPVGVALDRFGSRRMILAGALTMAAGQLDAGPGRPTCPLAIAARVLVGAGDAMTFISVLRVVGFWFPGGAVPLITQLTGIFGQVGSDRRRLSRWSRCCTATSLADDVPGRGRRRRARRRPRRSSPCATPRPGRRGPAPVGPRRAAAQPGRHLARAGHPDRAVHPPGHPVLRHRVRPALGLSVPRRRPGALTRRRRPGCSPCWCVVGMAVGPLLGRLCGRWPLRRSDLVFAHPRR